jgi:glycosyltransferase involved in cell wall biosynthesis
MVTSAGGLRIAYVHFGPQSGVTSHVAAALERRGHVVDRVGAVGDLDLRDPATRRARLTAPSLVNLAISAACFGRGALRRRWNTPFAFDLHSRAAGARLGRLPRPPQVVLQNGALFAPGVRPPAPYVLLLDYTSALAAGHATLPTSFPASWFDRERAAYAGAHAICTLSERAAESLRRHYGVDAGRLHVVGAGANVHPEHPARRDDGHTILFVGGAFARKGGPLLLEAFRRVRREDPRARLLVAGPAERLELGAGAQQLGHVPAASLAELFASATVFALPSLREPFGLAFLDAMACGVPCVGTAVDAIPEILAGGEAGILVPPNDPGALADALAAVLADPARARALGSAGRARVETTYRWDLVAARLDGVLRAAAASAVTR